jgi:Tol biopolymer transport system component
MPRVSAAGDLVFAAIDNRISVWGVGLDAQGKASGVPERLTADAGEGNDVRLSRDGKKMVFSSRRSGNNEVWMKDLETGKAAAVVTAPQTCSHAKSPPTARALSTGRSRSRRALHISRDSKAACPAALRGLLRVRCFLRRYEDPDLHPAGDTTGNGAARPRTGGRTDLLKDSKYDLADHALSPDGHWIAFRANLSPEQQRLFVIPVRTEGPPVEEKDWIAVSDARQLNYSPRWSPDGSRLYFISGRDGHRCIWAQRLHPSTRQPAESPSLRITSTRRATSSGSARALTSRTPGWSCGWRTPGPISGR